ncbi:MAG: class I SAM-dependent methyltransferase [Alphaproteobacteria bacterium]|nr:class I SAM-dependent methyltransferase [Alphaproteobacteria bacterium]
MDKDVFALSEIDNKLSSNNFCFIIDSDAEELEKTTILNDYFDFIISMSAFEHVANVNTCVKVIYKLLHNSGVFYTHFEPIYSSAKGHHLYINDDVYFAKLPQLNYKHLLNTKEEIKEFIDVSFDWSYDFKNRALYQMTDHGKLVNKKMFNDYILEIMNSPFNSYSINYIMLESVLQDIQIRLVEKFGDMRFDVGGFIIKLIK